MKQMKVGIIGGGRFGMTLAESLSANDVDVTLIDREWSVVQSLSQSPIRAINGDATNPDELHEAGFQDCDVAVVAIGSSLESSTLATINCKDFGVKQVIAKASSDLHGRVLERIGADIVVYPDRDRAIRLAKSLLAKSPIDFFEITEGYSVAETAVPKSLIGKSLIEGNVRQNFGMTVLAIRRPTDGGKGPRQAIIPNGTEILLPDDNLVVFISDDSLQRLAAAAAKD